MAEFLGLQPYADFPETEPEGSIISHLQSFIMEMGMGFAFVTRQKHIRFQAKYLTYLPTKEQLRQEIELQKQIFLEQKSK